VFISGSSNSSVQSFVFDCTVPQSIDDANLTRAISIYDVNNITIFKNLITQARIGIYMESTSGSSISQNQIWNVTDSIQSGGYGIVLTSTGGTTASENEISGNYISFPPQPAGAYPVGIFLSAPGPVQRTGPLQDNLIYNNQIVFQEQLGSFFGILLFDNGLTRSVDYNTVSSNIVMGPEFGIVLWGASVNTIEYNKIYDVYFVGIRLQQSKSQEAEGNTIYSNIVRGSEFGIVCVAGTSMNIIHANQCSDSNSNCDFYDAGTNNVFEDNTGTECTAVSVLFKTNFEKKYPPLPR